MSEKESYLYNLKKNLSTLQHQGAGQAGNPRSYEASPRHMFALRCLDRPLSIVALPNCPSTMGGAKLSWVPNCLRCQIDLGAKLSLDQTRAGHSLHERCGSTSIARILSHPSFHSASKQAKQMNSTHKNIIYNLWNVFNKNPSLLQLVQWLGHLRCSWMKNRSSNSQVQSSPWKWQ